MGNGTREVAPATGLGLGLALLAAIAIMVMVGGPPLNPESDLGRNRTKVRKMRGLCEFGLSATWQPEVRYNKNISYSVGPYFGAPDDAVTPFHHVVVADCESPVELVLTQEPGTGKISCRLTVNGLPVHAVALRDSKSIRCYFNP